MKKALKRAGTIISFFFLFLGVTTLVANASDFGPRRHGQRNQRPPVQQVVEPAAIVLLGAGLVSLGIYTKKKRSKKQ